MKKRFIALMMVLLALCTGTLACGKKEEAPTYDDGFSEGYIQGHTDGKTVSDLEVYNDGYDDASITARFNSYLEDIVKEYSLMVDMKGHTNVVYCDDFRYVQHDDGIGWDIYIKMELLTPLTKVLGKEITEEQTVQLGIDMSH